MVSLGLTAIQWSPCQVDVQRKHYGPPLRHAGPLTQFQEKGGSLLEETAGATQTQAPPADTPPAAQANTMSLVRCGRTAKPWSDFKQTCLSFDFARCVGTGVGHGMHRKTLAQFWLFSMASPCLAQRAASGSVLLHCLSQQIRHTQNDMRS